MGVRGPELARLGRAGLPSPGFGTLSRKGRGLTLNTYGPEGRGWTPPRGAKARGTGLRRAASVFGQMWVKTRAQARGTHPPAHFPFVVMSPIGATEFSTAPMGLKGKKRQTTRRGAPLHHGLAPRGY